MNLLHNGHGFAFIFPVNVKRTQTITSGISKIQVTEKDNKILGCILMNNNGNLEKIDINIMTSSGRNSKITFNENKKLFFINGFETSKINNYILKKHIVY